MRLDRATARRIAEALAESGALRGSHCQVPCETCIHQREKVVDTILRALAPAHQPPGRTKRGKKGRAE